MLRKTLTDNSIRTTLGLRANLAQFSLLVLVNAFVGAMVGLERTILPALAEEKYNLVATTAVLSFIVVFGIVKAITNYWAGSLSDRVGRRRVLIVGWLFAVPVPVLLIVAPTWEWILVANVFLGISQGLTWSTTVIMKIDLVGPYRRGLAMGFNEFAGYMAVAGSALATGFIAEHYGLSPEPFYLGFFYVAAGLALSIFLVRETKGFALHESSAQIAEPRSPLTGMPLFMHTTFRNRNLSTVVTTGFVNNLNDGVAWGLFPILFASVGLSVGTIGWLAALYPATWGVCQLYTGYLSDRIGRKRLIVGGMIVQSAGIALTAMSTQPLGFACAAILLGIGTAMVYPTLLAAIGDVADPLWRATSVGIYRFWRDAGYAVGALLAGILAQYLGVREAVVVVACITFLAGINALLRMDETLRRATEIKDR